MRPLTSQFSASVARRDHVVKKTCVGAGAAHRGRDRLCVLEIRAQRRDPLVEIPWVAAETDDVPTVGQQPSRDVAPADARDADDERASGGLGTVVPT